MVMRKWILIKGKNKKKLKVNTSIRNQAQALLSKTFKALFSVESLQDSGSIVSICAA